MVFFLRRCVYFSGDDLKLYISDHGDAGDEYKEAINIKTGATSTAIDAEGLQTAASQNHMYTAGISFPCLQSLSRRRR